jgi:ATP-binding cassette subfamily B protein IrtB
MPRPRKRRRVCTLPRCTSFGPESRQHGDPVKMTVDEYETIRLIDLEGLTQEQCADQMEVARTTAQAIYASARKKLAECIVNGLTLVIGGGEYRVCEHRDGRCGRGCRHRHCNGAYTMISTRIYALILTVLTMLAEVMYFFTSTKRMQQLRQEPAMHGRTDAALPDYNIELRNVTFAYNKDDVIKNMSITLPQNAVTALVGPSGSGKSTISRLIARFWDVNKGEILIGGRNIRDIDPETLMKYMSFVFQDVVLFNDTVINNIRIGKQGATDTEVRVAARIARCDEFIGKMENGYETLIGENGCTLSGGERQRISIARAILKNAPIVLLDEATASIDPENEVLIQEAISELIKGRTVIVIAHRLKTIAGANKIVVLDEGNLFEQGTHEELLAQNGLYAKLWHIQQESLGWSV